MVRSTATERGRRRIARTATLVASAACILGVAAPAWAATGDSPDKLLRAYPLEQRPTTVADVPRGPAAAAPSRSSGARGIPQGETLLVAGAVMMVALLVVARRGPWRAPREVAVAAAVPAAPAMPAAPEPPAAPAPPAAPEPAAAPEPPAATEPPPAVEEPRAPVARPAALPAARAKDGVVCQVHWRHEEDVSWFAAVMVQARKRSVIAESPDFAWAGPQPPRRDPEADGALQALIDDLCANGWTPVRGRGRESGAPRWYARRCYVAIEPHTGVEET